MYKMFSNCFLVKGILRALIYDTQRYNYEIISLEPYRTLKKKYFLRNELDNDLLYFLIDNEYVFEINKNEITYFPEINLEWLNNSLITNLILHNNYIENKIISNIVESLNIKAVGLIINNLSQFEISKINNLDKNLRQQTACSNIIIQIDKKITKKLQSKIKNYKITKNNKLFNCVIHKPSIPLFTESQAYHTYFNRKLYIGENGEIKNASECNEIFGNINDVKSVYELKQIIATPEFQKYWFVHKELCDVCKDCEFRHMCVDNRLPYQRTDGSWYHKIECNYNPYICKWKEEEDYKTLEECGIISNEIGFSIDHEKIAFINKMLWEEKSENA